MLRYADEGDLVLDSESHRYTSRGVLVPSVSQVLRGVGLVDGTYFDDEVSRRGTDVHELIALALRGQLDRDSVPPRYRGYVAGFDLFSRLHSPEPTLVEQLVHLPGRVAGTLDFFGHLHDQPLSVLLDWKTGAYRWWHEAQTAGYKQLVTEGLGRRVHRRGTVHLTAEGGQTLLWHTAHGGGEDWASALYIIERRIAHHGRDERERLCGGGRRDTVDEPRGDAL